MTDRLKIFVVALTIFSPNINYLSSQLILTLNSLWGPNGPVIIGIGMQDKLLHYKNPILNLMKYSV